MDAMKEAFDSMLPQITEQVAAQLRERAIKALEYQVTQAVGEEIKKYITDNIVPAVAAELKAKDSMIRAALVSGVIAAVEVLSGHLQESITKRIASYDGDKLVAEVMRVMTPSRY